jgi:malate dehydrogenase (oxaloacetate-decarboxylating)
MCIAAANELALCASEKGLSEDYIAPTMDEWEVYPREAVAVGLKAQEVGVAGLKLTKTQLLETATSIIKRSRDMTQNSMKLGYIPKAPD